MRPQRIVIAVPIEENLLKPLRDWGRSFDFEHVECVHFVHVVKKNITPLEFGLVETPDAETYREMVPTLKNFLKEESKRILPSDYHGQVEFLLTEDFNPEEEVIDLLNDMGATLIVVATRGKHGLDGLFHKSFTEYMVKHAPCDVFVVRPEPEEEREASSLFPE